MARIHCQNCRHSEEFASQGRCADHQSSSELHHHQYYQSNNRPEERFDYNSGSGYSPGFDCTVEEPEFAAGCIVDCTADHHHLAACRSNQYRSMA